MPQQAIASGDDTERHFFVACIFGFECALAIVEAAHMPLVPGNGKKGLPRDRGSNALVQRIAVATVRGANPRRRIAGIQVGNTAWQHHTRNVHYSSA
jgi:hypothetical protein